MFDFYKRLIEAICSLIPFVTDYHEGIKQLCLLLYPNKYCIKEVVIRRKLLQCFETMISQITGFEQVFFSFFLLFIRLYLYYRIFIQQVIQVLVLIVLLRLVMYMMFLLKKDSILILLHSIHSYHFTVVFFIKLLMKI